MREFSKISPTFWTGKTGKKLRKAGSSTQLLAAYLLTNPHANAIGIYYLPICFITHETALTVQGASKGLRRAFEGGFAQYDSKTEYVWIPNMLRYQIGESVKYKDNKRVYVQNEFNKVFKEGQVEFCQQFYEKYRVNFHLELTPEMERGFEGASKGLRSIETETETEIDNKHKGVREDANIILEHWNTLKHVAKIKSGHTKIHRERLRIISDRLNDGFTREELTAHMEKFDGKVLAYKWHVKQYGEDPSHNNGHWCPSITWTPDELFGEKRIKYLEKWADEPVITQDTLWAEYERQHYS